MEGEPGFGGDEPLKGPVGGDFDHVADASRYAKYNNLRLLRAEVEQAKKPVGAFNVKEIPNRPKRWY